MSCLTAEDLTKLGYLARLDVKNPVTLEWETVTGLRDTPGMSLATTAIDLPVSPSGFMRTKPGVQSLANRTYTPDWTHEQHQKFVSWASQKLTLDWRTVVPNADENGDWYEAFCAWIEGIERTGPEQNLMQSSLTLHPTGGFTDGYLS